MPALADDAPAAAEATQAEDGSSAVHVVTDVLDLEINTRGATLQKADLLKYPVDKDNPDEVVRLLSPNPERLGLMQTGLRARDENAEATHLVTFSAPADSYRMQDDVLEVPFTWTNGAGITVTKTFRFTRGSYRIDVTQTVRERDCKRMERG
ncbi:MAG: membrane protein insertase YidC [Woeseiaceae bacterium]|nr:membrane protein insertase YidC [Woeseiaceae bacterium]